MIKNAKFVYRVFSSDQNFRILVSIFHFWITWEESFKSLFIIYIFTLFFSKDIIIQIAQINHLLNLQN